MKINPSRKILVVEDDLDALEFLVTILTKANYEVASATEGKQAIALAKSFQPALIILDMILPDILGGEVVNILSEAPSTVSIPIIFLTGLDTKEDERILKGKIHNYHILEKPITIEELLEAVNKTILT